MECTSLVPALPDTDLSAAKADEIRKLHREISAALVKGAEKAFRAGMLLFQVQMRMDTYRWKDWVKSTLKISGRTVGRYIDLYCLYKDRPQELGKGGIKEALTAAALDNWTRKPKDDEPKGLAVRGNPRQYELDWEAIFAKPPVSRANLQNYRFECPDKRSLWLVKRGIDYPVKFLDLFTDQPKDDLKPSYDAMMKSIQAAVEMYYERVEQKEDAPFDEEA